MKINPNAPAYPIDPDIHGITCRGMTIRATMATKIMAGFAAGAANELPESADDIAVLAVEWADALIEALNAGGGA